MGSTYDNATTCADHAGHRGSGAAPESASDAASEVLLNAHRDHLIEHRAHPMPGHGTHVGMTSPGHLDEHHQLLGPDPQASRVGAQHLDGAAQVRRIGLDGSA